MTDINTMNATIALFMEWKYNPKIDWYQHGKDFGDFEFYQYPGYSISNLRFDSSWDWLKLVIDKISDIYNQADEELCSFIDREDLQILSLRICGPQIKYAHQCVYDFIKWFNEINDRVKNMYKKDWEIFTLSQIGNTVVEAKNFHENFISENLDKGFYKIHSVRRISDGDIFTVGDRCVCGDFYFEIQAFDIEDTASHELRVWSKTDEGKMKRFAYFNPEMHINRTVLKKQQPLFQTHDGEKVYHGDKVFKLMQPDSIPWYTIEFIARKDMTNHSSFFKYFYSLELAETYIDLYKPIYSRQDLMNAWEAACKAMGVFCTATVSKYPSFEDYFK